MSLSCALLATLLQQWARRYLLITQSHSSKLHDRARIRSFFAEGVIKFHLPKVVDALPALLHISVFLSLAGLPVYIYNIHHPPLSNPALYVVLWDCLLGLDTYANRPS